MKKYFNSFRFSRHLYVAVFVTFLSIFGLSCSKTDNPVVVPPDNTVTKEKMVLFRYIKSETWFRVNNTGTSLGNEISAANILSWDWLTGVEAGYKWVVAHNDNKSFAIFKMYSDGTIDPNETDYQEWNSNYETFVGFHVGTRGYIFGQDSHDKKWFIQEILPNGKLAQNEANHGTWHNYYKTCTPVYMNGNTLLFFQTSGSDHYWFMTLVDAGGNMIDVADGYWGDLWYPVIFYQQDGKNYLVGELPDGNAHGQWFIQAINSDGTMGAETDRGEWNNYYHSLAAFTYNGHTYLYGGADGKQNLGLNQFIQEVTADGKMGAEMSRFAADHDYYPVIPFTVLKNADNPGGFRYTIGWDLSTTSAAPARGWSDPFLDPWNGEVKFGGGAALAKIDGDANGLLDAVLMGTQSVRGNDRFYYKVAWNLDKTGKASGWSDAIIGPYVGAMQSGGGADIADIDRNGRPDLVLMSVDNPEGANSFWYYIGWNLSASGQPASWSGKFRQDGLGFDNAGGGLALGDLDGNGQPEMVLVAIDDPSGANQLWYRIGRNLDQSGNAASWTGNIAAPFYEGFQSAGGGAALADLNKNGKPDLVLMNIDSPTGANPFWCYVGWDIDINGKVASWSDKIIGPSLGSMTSGGGTAIGDIDKNGIMDLLLMMIDDPYRKD